MLFEGLANNYAREADEKARLNGHAFNKKGVPIGTSFRLVGVARLELAASWSRTMRATKLRYTPIDSWQLLFADFFVSVVYFNK